MPGGCSRFARRHRGGRRRASGAELRAAPGQDQTRFVRRFSHLYPDRAVDKECVKSGLFGG